MYQNFYGLSDEPFRLSPDHRFCFTHRSYSRAEAYLQYALYQAEGFLMLTGKPGTGKTTLINHILDEMSSTTRLVAKLETTQLEEADLLQMVAFAFRLQTETHHKATLLQLLIDFLTRQQKEKREPLLIVDEAQDLSPSAIEELRLLTNLQHDGRPLLQIFLVGQDTLRDLVKQRHMEQLQQRLVAAVHLEPLDASETKGYVKHRLGVVGWRGDPAIAREVFPLIHQYSDGVPRRINRICSRLFLRGLVEELHEISLDDAEHVVADLEEEQLTPQDSDSAVEPLLGGDKRFAATDANDLYSSPEDSSRAVDSKSRSASSEMDPTQREDNLYGSLRIEQEPKERVAPETEQAQKPVSPQDDGGILGYSKPIESKPQKQTVTTSQPTLDASPDAPSSDSVHAKRSRTWVFGDDRKHTLLWAGSLSILLAMLAGALLTFMPVAFEPHVSPVEQQALPPRERAGPAISPTAAENTTEDSSYVREDTVSLADWGAATVPNLDSDKAWQARQGDGVQQILEQAEAFLSEQEGPNGQAGDSLDLSLSEQLDLARSASDLGAGSGLSSTTPIAEAIPRGQSTLPSAESLAEPPTDENTGEDTAGETDGVGGAPLDTTRMVSEEGTTKAIAPAPVSSTVPAEDTRTEQKTDVKQKNASVVASDTSTKAAARRRREKDTASSSTEVSRKHRPTAARQNRPSTEAKASSDKDTLSAAYAELVAAATGGHKYTSRSAQHRAGEELNGLAELQSFQQPRAGLSPQVLLQTQVLFGLNSSAIRQKYKPVLDEVVATMKKSQRARAEIVGYTDTSGSASYNLQLSRRRANAVAKYLAKRGIPQHRLHTTGRGPRIAATRPAGGATRSNKTRRVVAVSVIAGTGKSMR